jgi:hypothetical protein
MSNELMSGKSLLLVLCLSTYLLSGCSNPPSAKGPILISFSDRQRAKIEPNVQGNTFGSIADRLSALPIEVYAGNNLPISEVILNDGLASKGVRLTVKGTAIRDGLLDMPKQASVRGEFTDKKHADVERSINFVADKNAGWQATVDDLPYGSQLEINMLAPAVKGGEGDLQIFVYPLARNGQSSATVTHIYKVLSEQEGRQEVPVPTDN